ncbi:hypothetical protein AB0F81_35605 [Actinoplanes sp. NPDC024001]|uniref:hypothetical protein n=1 Tax=Actinoplanes sp. NPDC024001 TaxID=3154598 RepID=UPI0033EC5A5D
MPHHPDVDFDYEAAYPDLRRLRSALARHDWPGCRAVLDATDPASRTGLIRLGGARPHEGFLRAVFRDDPADGAAAAMYGSCLIDIGWGIRGGGTARTVSRQQFDLFRKWLLQAEQVLTEGTARCPGDTALWASRLDTARGLQAGQAEARRRYDRLAEIDPHHWPAQMLMVQQLCPKWGGSWEAVHQFAHDAMMAAPAGGMQGGLVAEAHIEHWFSLLGDDNAAATAYLRSPAVSESIYQSAHRSIGAPEFRRDWGWVKVGSEFAFLFSELGDRAATAWLFDGLGPLATEFPWHWLRGDIVENIRARRAWARGEGEITR